MMIQAQAGTMGLPDSAQCAQADLLAFWVL